MKILTELSDADLKHEYQKVKRELKSGKVQMDSQGWFYDERNTPMHREPFTPADLIQEYKKRSEDNDLPALTGPV